MTSLALLRNIKLNFIKGAKIDLATEIGNGQKAFCLEFWATWCPPCRATIPHLTEMQKKFSSKNIVFIGITNEEVSVAKPFVEKMGAQMDYHVASEIDNSASAALMQPYKARGIPTAFLIGRDGKVQWHGHPADEQFERELEKIGNIQAKGEKNTKSEAELNQLSAKELKAILTSHSLKSDDCLEKTDLVKKILEHCS